MCLWSKSTFFFFLLLLGTYLALKFPASSRKCQETDVISVFICFQFKFFTKMAILALQALLHENKNPGKNITIVSIEPRTSAT